MNAPSEIFLVAVPGLEQPLAEEAVAMGFAQVAIVPGGVTIAGGWPEVWRANLVLRGASKVLARIGSFRALHLAQLDKRARKFPWGDFLRPDQPVRVEASTHQSRIYHAGAAAQRVARALTEDFGATVITDPKAADGPTPPIGIKVRIEDDLVTISLDTSGEGLHKRGHKAQVNKAPMRETMAAMFLRQCGYTGEGAGAFPVLDPMCGSGTFMIEAAEMALGLQAGRARAFAFERFAAFDAAAWDKIRAPQAPRATDLRFYGSDRDGGAAAMSRNNAKRAGVEGICDVRHLPISDLTAPEGPKGLVIVNPPYGTRIGERKPLFGLYGAFGQIMTERFQGWRVAMITTDAGLAKATNLPFLPPGPPVAHGGLKVTLWQTAPLA